MRQFSENCVCYILANTSDGESTPQPDSGFYSLNESVLEPQPLAVNSNNNAHDLATVTCISVVTQLAHELITPYIGCIICGKPKADLRIDETNDCSGGSSPAAVESSGVSHSQVNSAWCLML